MLSVARTAYGVSGIRRLRNGKVQGNSFKHGMAPKVLPMETLMAMVSRLAWQQGLRGYVAMLFGNGNWSGLGK